MHKIENIETLIPHRPPFVMIDKLLAFNETTTRIEIHIKTDNILVERGLFKVPRLVEHIAQTAAARTGYIAKRANKPVR